MKLSLHLSLVVVSFAFFGVTHGPASADDSAPAKRPNVLFIAVDDLNHFVGHLGRNAQVKTPNIDKLAARGVTFSHAYSAAPVCNPSRAALLSGRRPSSTGVYSNGIDWRPAVPEEQTLMSHFRRHGYFVAGAGKVYHGGFDRRSEWDDYLARPGGDPKPSGNDGVAGIKFAPLDCQDEDLADYKIASWIIEQLGKTHDKPFFLACGLHKPHMPWNVPRKYYDMYPADKIELPKTLENDLEDVPAGGIKMANPGGDHAAILKSGRWKEAVQGYLAAISYTDMNVGRLIEALDKSPHKENTIVVLWGDHGWHLGEKQHWRKFALWEEATRAPLVWVAPGVTRAGGVCEATVDFMSIYPTLSELCGLPVPKHCEGTSTKALLANPKATWTTPAITTHGRNNHAVRTDKWRYIRYADGGEELYDETRDPLEWSNLAAKPEHAATKESLAKMLPEKNVPTAGARRAGKK